MHTVDLDLGSSLLDDIYDTLLIPYFPVEELVSRGELEPFPGRIREW